MITMREGKHGIQVKGKVVSPLGWSMTVPLPKGAQQYGRGSVLPKLALFFKNLLRLARSVVFFGIPKHNS